MRRNLQNVVVRNNDTGGRLQNGSVTYKGGRKIASKRGSRHDIIPMDRRELESRQSLDAMLSSGLLTQDKQLAGILQEVREISNSLQSNTADLQTLNRALRRTVLCALKRSLLDRELRSLALTDELTGLYNRRAFLAVASQQLKLGRRKGQGILLLFADVNNLKDINDCHGHREGDLALIRAAHALEQTFRDSDVIARLGGDEFAVLALEASSQDEQAILGRLKDSLQAAAASEGRYELSLAVGVARFDPKHSLSLEALLAEADHAMYKEKRNRPRLSATRP
jgi:diguanylate cyclase (GGDEF)-like protein